MITNADGQSNRKSLSDENFAPSEYATANLGEY